MTIPDVSPPAKSASEQLLLRLWREQPSLRAQCADNYITFLGLVERTMLAAAEATTHV